MLCTMYVDNLGRRSKYILTGCLKYHKLKVKKSVDYTKFLIHIIFSTIMSKYTNIDGKKHSKFLFRVEMVTFHFIFCKESTKMQFCRF